MFFVPAKPHVGTQVQISVTSQRHHNVQYMRWRAVDTGQASERPGYVGWVWTWMVLPQLEGWCRFTFYAVGLHPCITAGFNAYTAVGATATPSPTNLPARITGLLKLGAVGAHDLMHTFQGTGCHSSLARALAEYGRIGKTLHLLDLADDEVYRRDLLIQVNTRERRHGLARVVFHGRRGQLRQAYRDGQEDELGALGLVLDAIVVWNTRYIGLALHDLQKIGMPINPEDVERLSPLLHHHIHRDGG